MSYESERLDFETRFNTLWTAAYPAVPIAYANVAFDPEPVNEFVDFYVIPGGSNGISVGTPTVPLIRYTGVAMAIIHTTINSGEQRGRQLSQTVIDGFRNLSFTNIICRSPYINIIGVVNKFYQVNVIIPFQRDEIS